MLVPKLRFPGFEGGWPSKKIGEILTVGNGRDYKHLGEGDIPVYGTGGYMLSVDDYLYEGESVAIGRKGTIDKPQFLSGKFWTVDTLFYTRDYVDSCPRFVFEIFNNINWQRYNEATSVPSLSKSTIEKVKVNIPSEQEQEKIAAFLTVVDERIELASRKVEKLETYKRGLTQKIFTRTLRFKRSDGSDFSDWGEKRLGDFANIYQPVTISQDEIIKGEYPVHGANGVIGYHNSYNHELPQIAVTCRGNTCGTVNFTTEKSWITGNAMVINVDDSTDIVDKIFLLQMLKFSDLSYLITGSGQPQITGEIKKHKVSLTSLEEQQKIATFLSQIDEKITLEAQKLEELKKFKKALLQRIFV